MATISRLSRYAGKRLPDVLPANAASRFHWMVTIVNPFATLTAKVRQFTTWNGLPMGPTLSGIDLTNFAKAQAQASEAIAGTLNFNTKANNMA